MRVRFFFGGAEVDGSGSGLSTSLPTSISLSAISSCESDAGLEWLSLVSGEALRILFAIGSFGEPSADWTR